MSSQVKVGPYEVLSQRIKMGVTPVGSDDYLLSRKRGAFQGLEACKLYDWCPPRGGWSPQSCPPMTRPVFVPHPEAVVEVKLIFLYSLSSTYLCRYLESISRSSPETAHCVDAFPVAEARFQTLMNPSSEASRFIEIIARGGSERAVSLA